MIRQADAVTENFRPGTLAARRDAEPSGLGQRVDISQQGSVVTLTENAIVNHAVGGMVATPLGNEHPLARPSGAPLWSVRVQGWPCVLRLLQRQAVARIVRRLR